MKIPIKYIEHINNNDNITITYIDEDDNIILMEHPNGVLAWGYNYWEYNTTYVGILCGINWKARWDYEL